MVAEINLSGNMRDDKHTLSLVPVKNMVRPLLSIRPPCQEPGCKSTHQIDDSGS